MKLSQLLRCEKKLADLEIKGITNDSRKVEKDFAFINTARNLQYDIDALQNGAAIIITEHHCDFENAIKVENAAKTFAQMSAVWYGSPAKSLKILGVTGTNGKTSVTYMLKAILENSGKKVGLIGTNQNLVGDRVIPSINTTPNAYYLNGLLKEMRDAGCEYVVMEVSSHALVNENVFGIDFSIAMFTNLTHDHLDFHGSMEEYLAAKKKLFTICKTAIINADDRYSQQLVQGLECKKVFYSVDNLSDFQAKAINCLPQQVNFKLLSDDLTHIKVNTGGKFTVYNALCAIACARELGISIEEISSALTGFLGVKGRAEVIPNTGDFTVIIDYAHTPDGLKNVLKTFKECAKNRLVLLFGCGGDRDKTKRALMGEIASIYSDYMVITSDNPRSENSADIIKDIMKGIPNGLFKGKVIEDRYEAIKFVLSIAQKDDIIILAGKGHEQYQIIGTEKRFFDELEIVNSLLSPCSD